MTFIGVMLKLGRTFDFFLLLLYRLTLPFVVGFLNTRLNIKRKLKKQATVPSTNFNVYPYLSNEHSKFFIVIYQPKKRGAYSGPCSLTSDREFKRRCHCTSSNCLPSYLGFPKYLIFVCYSITR